MAVRTKRLAAGKLSSGTALNVFTCPDGETAIVKTIVTYAEGGANASAFSIRTAAAPTVDLWQRQGPGVANTVEATFTWLVMHPGDVLRLFRASTSFVVQYSIHGTELEGVAD